MLLKNLGIPALLAALWIAASPAAATTLLTNGSEIYVKFPEAPRRTVYNGAQGYTVLAPPGATELRVEFRTTPNHPIELLVQDDFDVATDGMGNRSLGFDIADYRAVPNNAGDTTIVISPITHPALKPGIYFIGFITRAEDIPLVGFLKATVSGGPIDGLFSLVESEFETDAEGWALNDTPSPLPGTNVGQRQNSMQHFSSGGNPGGFIRMRDVSSGPDAFFVAPSKFLINLLDRDDPRIEFDIARITGSAVPDEPVEIRVYGARGGYLWKGQPPQAPNEGFAKVSVPIRFDFWHLFSGPMPFVEAFRDPKRIEIRASYSVLGGSTGLDNVFIYERGDRPARPVLVNVTAFSAGFDEWDRNFHPGKIPGPGETVGDQDSRLVWVNGEGNPGPFIRLSESGGPGADAFLAPIDFQGIYTGLVNPRFEFDYYHTSFTKATRPVTIRIFGAGAVFEWAGKIPDDIWAHQTAPLTASAWTRISGASSFAAVLGNVTRIEIGADLAAGAEWNQIDNFAVLSDQIAPLPRFLTSDPTQLEFQGVATQPSPEGQDIRITSANGLVRWSSGVTGDLAGRVQLSQETAETPSRVRVTVDTEGLPAGTHNGRLVISAVGATVADHVIEINVELAAQPNATPVITAVRHAADYSDQLASGVLGVIFGQNLGGSNPGFVASYVGPFDDRLPTKVNGIRVLIYETWGGLIGEAPILYLGDKQINFQMLYEVAGRAFVRVVIDNGGVRSAPFPVQIINNAPGIFLFNGNRAVAVNSDGTVNTPSNPQQRLEPMVLYMTGQGLVAPRIESGQAATSAPLIRTPEPIIVWIGGVEARIEFAGLAPGLVGVLQVNLIPRSATPIGDQAIWASIGGFGSNIARVTIR